MFMPLYVILFLFNYSALQLTDDAIHLSLSPTRMTTPPSAGNNLNNNGVLNVTASTDLTTLTKLSNGNNTVLKKKELSTGDLSNNYELTFREVSGTQMTKSNMQRSTSWYDGFFGCLKPVWSFMGKNKPSNLQNSAEGKIFYIFKARNR